MNENKEYLRTQCATSDHSLDVMNLNILDRCNLGINQLVLGEISNCHKDGITDDDDI